MSPSTQFASLFGGSPRNLQVLFGGGPHNLEFLFGGGPHVSTVASKNQKNNKTICKEILASQG